MCNFRAIASVSMATHCLQLSTHHSPAPGALSTGTRPYGICTVQAVAALDPAALHARRMAAAGPRAPTLPQVRVWVRAAAAAPERSWRMPKPQIPENSLAAF